MLDLIALVADLDTEITLRTLLGRRHDALGIRPIRFDKHQADCLREPMHDAGTFTNAQWILRPYQSRAHHALVILDRHGSGRESDTAAAIEQDIEGRLIEMGWHKDRIAAIVLDPELEIWVWSGSPHVQQVLNITDEQMAQVHEKFPANSVGKPWPPKEAMLYALRLARRPHSARIFEELAERVSLRSEERAFMRLRDTVQRWFPQSNT